MNMSVGYYLNDLDVKELLASIVGQEKFHNLLTEMKRYNPFDFNVDSIEVIEGFKFDTISPKQEVITAKAIDLKINEKISIRYITRYFNGNVDETSDFFTGYLVNETTENDSTVYHQTIFRAADEQTVSMLESTLTKEVVAANKEQEARSKEEYNFDENYYPGQLLEQVNSEGMLDGCLGGGYIFCGGQCGGWPACTYNNQGKNDLDRCCKTHDCCYKSNGVEGYPDCYCDQGLCDCSQASSAPTWDKIQVQTAMCFIC